MSKDIAAVFENNLNFNGVSHSICFFDTIEEAMAASRDVDDGGPYPATSIFQYALPAKVAWKSVEWVDSIKKKLPDGVSVIDVEYRPIMRNNYSGSTYPFVDGIEIELRLGNFFGVGITSPFSNTKIRIGFFQTKEFGVDIVKQDYFYEVVKPNKKGVIKWKNVK